MPRSICTFTCEGTPVDALQLCVALHPGTQTPRPMASTLGVEPNKGHLQEALLSLGSAHTHFGHVQVFVSHLLYEPSMHAQVDFTPLTT